MNSSKFANIENALQIALNNIKDEIKTSPVQPEFKPEKSFKKPRSENYQTLNGNFIKWEFIGDKKIPVIRTNKVYIEYPPKDEECSIPDGTTRATYNKEKKCVEFYSRGNDKPIKIIYNQKHEGLPYPRYMQGLEYVEEILDLDLETGEVTTELKINILDEYSHWFLRLQEYEIQALERGVDKFVIGMKLKKFVKNLKKMRGIDMLDPNNKIKDSLLDAIEFIKMKQARI